MGNQRGFNKLFWGFLFIMIDFRLQGFDILPDIVGYVLFALGFSALAENSEHFRKAGNLNIVMIILSVFSIFDNSQNQNQGGGVNFGYLGWFGFIIGIAVLVIGLMSIYNLFMGIKDMAEKRGQADICEEADRRWKQYLLLTLAGFFGIFLIFIPPLALIFIFGIFIAGIFMTVLIMGFMKSCGERMDI